MSIGAGGGSSESSSSSSSDSRPSTPEELMAYFNALGSVSGGRLNTFATQGTTPTNYDALTQAQLQAIGGAGATRQTALDTSYEDQTDQINRDSSLTYAQCVEVGHQLVRGSGPAF